jgi:hypothetical protein
VTPAKEKQVREALERNELEKQQQENSPAWGALRVTGNSQWCWVVWDLLKDDPKRGGLAANEEQATSRAWAAILKNVVANRISDKARIDAGYRYLLEHHKQLSRN